MLRAVFTTMSKLFAEFTKHYRSVSEKVYKLNFFREKNVSQTIPLDTYNASFDNSIENSIEVRKSLWK